MFNVLSSNSEGSQNTNLETFQRYRAAISYVLEPSDTIGAITLDVLGTEIFYDLISGQLDLDNTLRRSVVVKMTSASQKNAAVLQKAVTKWRGKFKEYNPGIFESHINAGGFLLIPDNPEHWPAGLNDLGINKPVALWGRGKNHIPELSHCVGIVGSRQSTSYGQKITSDMSYDLVESGQTIISGGAFGIDACAHRSALAARVAFPGQSKTIAIVAGGVDTYYPRQHQRLYEQIIAEGSYLSEAFPGTQAGKWRFLQRNRLIAALSSAVCVTEARQRSGALSTAHHAFDIFRHVLTVPGSVFSPTSAGCHQLITKNLAQLVTSAEDILRFVVPLTDYMPHEHQQVLPLEHVRSEVDEKDQVSQPHQSQLSGVAESHDYDPQSLEGKIISCLSNRPELTIDQLSQILQSSAQALTVALAVLLEAEIIFTEDHVRYSLGVFKTAA